MKYRNKIAIISLLLFLSACAVATKNIFPDGEWVDLSHDFSEQTVSWPTAEMFKFETVFEGMTDAGFYYSAYQFAAAEHSGTHIDSPVHFASGKDTVDQIPLEKLIGAGVVIDVSVQTLANPDYQISVQDFISWESQNGKLPQDAIVLLRTGYSKYWPDRKKYMGTAGRDPAAVADLHFPGLAPQAAEWLIKNRQISAIGLDTPSIDFGQSTLFKSHQVLFQQNIPAFENLANLDRLPEKGAFVIALPMKIKGGSGAPLRIVALVPKYPRKQRGEVSEQQ